jgi:aldose 1-epimerase
MYRVENSQVASRESIKLLNKSSGESVEIIPELGGMVYQITLQQEALLKPLLFTDKTEELGENPEYRGRLLFPFHDRIPGGKYSFAGKQYQLEINNHADSSAIHGLIAQEPLQILRRGELSDSCSVTLGYRIDKNRFKGYPFELELEVEYCLSEGRFELYFNIHNFGQEVTPCTLGWHPYFTLDQLVDNCTIEIAAPLNIEMGEDLVPTGKITPCRDTPLDFYTAKKIGNLELDIALKAAEDGTTVLGFNQKKIVLKQDTNFLAYTQIYIPVDRLSVAIEPVSAGPNAFNHHNFGLTALSPGEMIKTSVVVSV